MEQFEPVRDLVTPMTTGRRPSIPLPLARPTCIVFSIQTHRIRNGAWNPVVTRFSLCNFCCEHVVTTAIGRDVVTDVVSRETFVDSCDFFSIVVPGLMPSANSNDSR